MKTIKEVRKEKGLTQMALATKAGLYLTTVVRHDGDPIESKEPCCAVDAIRRALK